MHTTAAIARVADHYDNDIQAARELYRRACKGLPSDRFGSHNEMMAAARGIGALLELLDLSATHINELQEADFKRGVDAMSLGS